jgi:hypothetical protein
MLVLPAELVSAELKGFTMDFPLNVVNVQSAQPLNLKQIFGSMPKTTSL